MKLEVATVHLYVKDDPRLEQVIARLDRLGVMMHRLIGQHIEGAAMASKEFEALKKEVERNTSVDESVKALVTKLADQIAAAKDDPAALQALADQLRADNDAVAAVVTANTPADTSGGSTAGEGGATTDTGGTTAGGDTGTGT